LWGKGKRGEGNGCKPSGEKRAVRCPVDEKEEGPMESLPDFVERPKKGILLEEGGKEKRGAQTQKDSGRS